MPIATPSKIKLNTIEEAIADIKAGKIIIVVDDEDRENEGDFICAAECITPEIINFMATHGRGLICSPITGPKAKELQLNRMVTENTDLHGTAFTVSVDYKLKGCTTGISAFDRATGIKALIDPKTKPEDFARPGHIFPLIGKTGGVLRRTGHTEAAIDLAVMAGYYPAGVLVEILNPDGTMARLPQLVEIAKKLGLKLISIEDLVAYRMNKERLVKEVNRVEIETLFGPFELICFKETNTNLHHLVVKKGNLTTNEPILTRVHASSNTGDLFALLLKNYSTELHKTLEIISNEGKGALILLRYTDNEDIMFKTVQALQDQQQKGKPPEPIHQKGTRNGTERHRHRVSDYSRPWHPKNTIAHQQPPQTGRTHRLWIGDSGKPANISGKGNGFLV